VQSLFENLLKFKLI